MTPDTDGDPRLEELLLRWEELHDQGRSLSPEELCSTCPELAEELGRRIALLRRFEPLGDRGATEEGERPRPTAAPSRESATARAEFRDLRFHAAGALGEVFMARNAELNREVALKFLKPERSRDADSRRRFLQEAEVTGRLEHPGVVPIYALGTDAAGSPCYAMRFIRGATLQDAIDAFHAAEKPGRDRSERSLSLRELLNRFVSICSTMGYAHSRGILHRDLKPRNVMLGRYDETLVVDWGLARTFERDEAARSAGEETLMPGSGEDGSDTPTVGVVGTPAYMSPEQAEARWDLVGPASDIFSLGGILYAILTGNVPYQGKKVAHILERVKRCEFPAPRELKPNVPRALEAICLKAMARRPGDRYATATELAADVRRWLADEPVMAYSEPSLARARRWMRRHRTLVASAAMVLVFGLASLAAFAAMLSAKNRELDAKNEALSGKNGELDAANAALSAKNRELDARNAELAEKNAELERQRRRAEERESLAIAAVARFRDVVLGNPELRDRPELEALRRSLLGEPLEFFRKLRDQLQADRDTRPESLLRLALAGFELASTAGEMGTIPDAVRSYSESSEILRRLIHDRPATAEYRSRLAANVNNMANLFRASGRTAEALASYRESLTIGEELARDDPDNTNYRRKLAVSHSNIGAVLTGEGRTSEAMESLLKARAIVERLVREFPRSAEYLCDLALIHHNIGHLHAAGGRSDEAMESYRRATELLEKPARDQPGEIRYRIELARNYEYIGVRLGATGHPVEAMQSHRKALALRERLAREHPSVTRYRAELARSYNATGALLDAAGRPTEAVESRRRAMEILAQLVRDHPIVVEYRSELIRSLGQAGRSLGSRAQTVEAIESFREALAAWERLVNDHPDSAELRRDLAWNQENLGAGLWYARDYCGSAEAHRKAIANCSALLKATPSDLAARRGLSLSQVSLGNALRDVGDIPAAAESYRQSIATARILVDASPEDAQYRATLGRAFHTLGQVRQMQGQIEDAIASYREALAHEQLAFERAPEEEWHRRILSDTDQSMAFCLRSAGRVAEAARFTKARRALWGNNAAELYECVRELAACVPLCREAAARQALAGDAVQALGEAIAVGWYSPRFAARDPVLDPLRDRDDFRQLLARLFDIGFPDNPFAH